MLDFYIDNEYHYQYKSVVQGVIDLPAEKNTFASWLAQQLAPTVCGSKPATILTLADGKCLPLYKWWDMFGEDIMAETVIAYRIFVRDSARLIVLFYRPEVLHRHLELGEVKRFLRRFAYPAGKGVDGCLQVLQARFCGGCPHEIGVFLGIPLKDVLGFMGLSGEPLSCRGEWCVFGDAAHSLGAMRRFADDRDMVAARLRQGRCPLAVLAGGGGDTGTAMAG